MADNNGKKGPSDEDIEDFLEEEYGADFSDTSKEDSRGSSGRPSAQDIDDVLGEEYGYRSTRTPDTPARIEENASTETNPVDRRKKKLRESFQSVIGNVGALKESLKERFTKRNQPISPSDESLSENQSTPETNNEFARRILEEYEILGGIGDNAKRGELISDERLQIVSPKEGIPAELAEDRDPALKALSILVKARVLERLAGTGKNNLSNRKRLAEGELKGIFYEDGLPVYFEDLNPSEKNLIEQALSDCAAPRGFTPEDLQNYLSPDHNGSILAAELNDILKAGTLHHSDTNITRALLLKIQTAHQADEQFSLMQFVEKYERNQRINQVAFLIERDDVIQETHAKIERINALLLQMDRAKKDQTKVAEISKKLDYELGNLSPKIVQTLSTIEINLPQEAEGTGLADYIKSYAPMILKRLQKEKELYDKGNINGLFMEMFNQRQISQETARKGIKLARDLGINQLSQLKSILSELKTKKFMGEGILDDSEKLNCRDLLFQMNLREEQGKGSASSKAKIVASAASRTCDDIYDGTINHLKAAENQKILRVKGSKTTFGRIIPWAQIVETEIKKLSPFKTIKDLPLELSEAEIGAKVDSGELDYDAIPKLISVLDDIILGKAPDSASKNALYDYTILGFRERIRKYWLDGIFSELEDKIVELEKVSANRDKLDELIKEETEKTFEIINDAFGKATAYKTSGEKDKEKKETEEKEGEEKRAKKREKIKAGLDKFSHLNSKTATAANVINTGLNLYGWLKNRKKKD